MGKNVLILLVDEMRFPPQYENEELRAWRRKYLPNITSLLENGLQFIRHYTSSTACAPSRASLFTGQYPTLHGVSQTDGAAKHANDPDMFWLNQNTVPTLGSYLEAAGYETYYKGKWHVSNSDIYVPGTNLPILSYDSTTGIPNPRLEQIYHDAQRLEPFGFSEWIGPNPHGTSPHESGSSAAIGVSGRDITYARETVALLGKLNQRCQNRPWCIVSSFVDPHDIALYGELTKNFPIFNFEIDPSVPDIPPAPNADNIQNKPDVQGSYRNTYQEAFQPTVDNQDFRRLYFSLQMRVDAQLGKVLAALNRTRFAKDTLIVFTSDHGDLLGSHGLFQKWYCVYEEAIHVPFSFSGHGIPRGIRDNLTTHVDVIPTILDILRIDREAIFKTLASQFTDIYPLVGKNMFRPDPAGIYFMTIDNVTKGLDQIGWNGQPYESVIQPSNVETIIVHLDQQLFKYSRYTDTTSQNPVPDQFEMYNLTEDPYEFRNLASIPSREQAQLKISLTAQREAKLRYPRTYNPPGPLPRPS